MLPRLEEPLRCDLIRSGNCRFRRQCLAAGRMRHFAPGTHRQVLLCRCAGANRPSLLKTFTAVYRPPLRRLKRDRCLFPALRADRFRFDSLGVVSRTRIVVPLRSIGFARLAPLRLVLEALVGKKHLLAGGKDEFSAAFAALQDLVMVFHTLLRGPCSRREGSQVDGESSLGEGRGSGAACEPGSAEYPAVPPDISVPRA